MKKTLRITAPFGRGSAGPLAQPDGWQVADLPHRAGVGQVCDLPFRDRRERTCGTAAVR